ncbi:MAG: ABC transporter permease [Vulcanimicrobiaceae bacterium]
MIDYLLESLAVLRANGIRTFLAILGLSIGVAAIVSVQILGYAMSGAVSGSLNMLSNRMFLIQPNSQQSNYRTAGMTQRDLAAVRNTVPGVREVYPLFFRQGIVRLGHRRIRLMLGDVGDAQSLTTPLAAGRYFTRTDLQERARIAILSHNAEKRLNPNGAEIIGKSVRAGAHTYRIVGILQKPATGVISSFVNFTPDVAIPYTTAVRQYMQGAKYYGAAILVHHVAELNHAEVQTIRLLKARKGGKVSYETFDRKQAAQQLGSVFGVLSTVVSLIGGISLLVAGIGIMNILLVSIAERTREIGIRKAIGAKRSQIMLQFFIEAALLAFGGSLLGCGIGLALGAWVNTAYIVKVLGVIVPIPWLMTVELAVIFATIVTLAFGTYPALRASRLNPIEALRYE